MSAQRLRSVTCNLGSEDGSFRSDYLYGLVYENDLFDIQGMDGPYTLHIEVQTTDAEGEAINLKFSGANGVIKEVPLPKDEWLPRIIERVRLTEEYNRHLKHADYIELENVNVVKATHHDTNAKTLEGVLLQNGIQISGDLKRGKNGLPTDTFNAARDLFGTITDAMTPLISKMGEAAYSARPKGREDL